MSYIIAFCSEAVVQYSVKTCHPYFYNQLYHGVDEYGLAGSWLSDALNTNIHTFEVAPAFIAIEHSLLAYIWQLFGWAADQVDSSNKILLNNVVTITFRYLIIVCEADL